MKQGPPLSYITKDPRMQKRRWTECQSRTLINESFPHITQVNMNKSGEVVSLWVLKSTTYSMRYFRALQVLEASASMPPTWMGEGVLYTVPFAQHDCNSSLCARHTLRIPVLAKHTLTFLDIMLSFPLGWLLALLVCSCFVTVTPLSHLQ